MTPSLFAGPVGTPVVDPAGAQWGYTAPATMSQSASQPAVRSVGDCLPDGGRTYGGVQWKLVPGMGVTYKQRNSTTDVSAKLLERVVGRNAWRVQLPDGSIGRWTTPRAIGLSRRPSLLRK